MDSILNFIDGQFCKPSSGQFLDNYEPATGKVYSRISDSDEKDLEMAVNAAEKALPAWSGMSIEDRSRILIRLADLIERDIDTLSAMESRDAGKPLKLSREIEIPRAAANFRFFGAAIMNTQTEAHLMEGVAVNYTRRSPIGIVGCISPWNLPLYLFTWKIAPALATGNCVVAKPSELTPATAAYLGKLCNEAGIPKGVLNVLHGLGKNIGQKLVDHPKIKAISFTGGTQTGRIIAESAAKSFKKISLELGGKNPILVFEDADLEEAVKTTLQSSFRNQGEICLCGSRILIQESIYGKFRDMLLAKIPALVIGDPMDDNTDFGALISKEHLEKVEGFINRAKEVGGNILTGGKRITDDGYYFQPTIIEGLDENCEINQQEVFGPVATLLSFKNEDEALRIANSTEYGLACSIWSKDSKRALRIAHQIQSGIVWVNCWMLRDLRTPFGGMKNSGVGREGGNEALRFFTEAQNICIKQ